MMNHLDLLVFVFMLLATISLLAVSLMFLTRRPRIRQVSFFTTVALGIYACSISCRIFYGLFPFQFMIGLILGAMSIAALILERKSNGDSKKQNIARILAAVSLVVGILNAFM